jgi:hypothetical protein
MDPIDEYDFEEDYTKDSDFFEEEIFSDAFKDRERAGGLEFGGVLTGTEFEGDSKMAKMAKKLGKLNRSDQEIFADKALRAINIINSNCNLNITPMDINLLISKCQIIQDQTFKSTIAIILSAMIDLTGKDKDSILNILNCAGKLRISLLDIIKYKRLLKNYKIIK